MSKIKDVQTQEKFCFELAEKLHERIKKAEVRYGRVELHTQLENDIVRLRRELNALREMLSKWDYER